MKSNLHNSLKETFGPPNLFLILGYLKKINAFLVYIIVVNETVYYKWCLDKSVGQTENDFD